MSWAMTKAAFEQAKAVGHGWVGPDHFLLALLANPSTATDVLKGLGVTYQTVFVRERTIGDLGRSSHTVRPGQGTLRSQFGRREAGRPSRRLRLCRR
jgi:hypothetical protein